MIWIDSVLCLLPGVTVSTWAHARILRAYAAGSRVAADPGLTGAEAAQRVMHAGGATGIAIEPASGELSDYYDSRNKVLRLSRTVREGHTLAAIGTAAHQAGHAIQHAAGYPGLLVRDILAPLAGLGSQVCWLVLAAGILLGMERLVTLAIVLFSLLVLLQVLNLPVELDAGRRARQALRAAGLPGADEEPIIAQVVEAASWTHVAAALTGGLTPVSFATRLRWPRKDGTGG